MTTKKYKIGIVGSGLVGRSWAMSFASGGHEVSLFDTDEKQCERALQDIEKQLKRMENDGNLLGTATAEEQFKLIKTCTSLKDCLYGASYVQECVPQSTPLKEKVFKQMGEFADDNMVLVSSSSGTPGSEFTENMKHRNRALVGHPLNPPYYVPLVEVVPTPWTDKDATEKACEILEGIGKSVVKLKKEIQSLPAIIIQNAVIQEGIRLVLDGVCSVEDVEKCMVHGLGLRWAFIGPLMTQHLNHKGGMRGRITATASGHDTVNETFGPAVPMNPDSEAMEEINRQLCEMTPLDKLQERGEWRDTRMIALAKLKREMKEENA